MPGLENQLLRYGNEGDFEREVIPPTTISADLRLMLLRSLVPRPLPPPVFLACNIKKQGTRLAITLVRSTSATNPFMNIINDIMHNYVRMHDLGAITMHT